MRALFRILFLVGTFLKIFPVFADTNLSGGISFENVNFLADRDFFSINDQETFRGDLQLLFDNERFFMIDAHPRINIDFMDHSRNRYLPLESSIRFYSRNHHLKVTTGLLRLKFGRSPLFNPLDITNRLDLEDNFFQPERLGELMLHLQKTWAFSGKFSQLQIQAFFLPLLLETPLPELDTRFPLQGQAGLIPYTLTQEQDTLSRARALSGGSFVDFTISPIDLGVFYYHGAERTPGFVLRIDQSGALRLTPFYYVIDAVGLTAECSFGGFTAHWQGAYKITAANASVNHEVPFEDGNATPKSYGQLVAGLDYTFNDVIGSGSLTLLGEYYRELPGASTLRNFRPFQNDLFVGINYNFSNNLRMKAATGVVKDLVSSETAVVVDFSARIYQNLRVSLSGILVKRSIGATTPISFFRNNSHVGVKLSYEFSTKLTKKMIKPAHADQTASYTHPRQIDPSSLQYSRK